MPIASWLIASDLQAQDILKPCHTLSVMTRIRTTHVSTWQLWERQEHTQTEDLWEKEVVQAIPDCSITKPLHLEAFADRLIFLTASSNTGDKDAGGCSLRRPQGHS